MMKHWDTRLFRLIYGFTNKHHWVNKAAVCITNGSRRLFYFLYGGMILYLTLKGDIRIIPFLAGPAAALLCGRLLRWIVRRKRPFVAMPVGNPTGHKDDPSFPSMHALSAFAIAMSVWYVAPAIGTVVLLLAGVTGLSRVMVGVHFPGDVAAGALLGLLISLATFNYATVHIVISAA